jgi:hypothetical protein
MKYYIHKKTGEPLALLDNCMVDVHKANKAIGYQNQGERQVCVNLCIFPERWSSNGVPFMAIPFPELYNFRRISKEKFNVICPDFGQFRHKDDKTISRFSLENIPVRKKTFGS